MLLLCAQAENNAAKPLPQRVLVVYNAQSRDSRRVAEHYMAKRKIPRSSECALRIDDRTSQGFSVLHFADLEKYVKAPIKKCLESAGKENILYIVLSYQIPFRLLDRRRGQGMAIDQYVADIWDEISLSDHEENPYFIWMQGRTHGFPEFVPLADYREKPGAKTIYSVWRLDAATPVFAMRLVDNAMEAEAHGLSGKVCIDRRMGEMESIKDSGYGSGDWSLHRAADFARAAGFNVVEDANLAEFGSAPAPLRCDDAALYAGWYALDNYNNAFTWNTGAIGLHLDSNSAVSPRTGRNWSANALKKGITVTVGAVEEPYLEGLPHPDVVFGALFDGANVGDAALAGVRWLKWMIINIGDPLYRPFPQGKPGFRKTVGH